MLSERYYEWKHAYTPPNKTRNCEEIPKILFFSPTVISNRWFIRPLKRELFQPSQHSSSIFKYASSCTYCLLYFTWWCYRLTGLDYTVVASMAVSAQTPVCCDASSFSQCNSFVCLIRITHCVRLYIKSQCCSGAEVFKSSVKGWEMNLVARIGTDLPFLS